MALLSQEPTTLAPNVRDRICRVKPTPTVGAVTHGPWGFRCERGSPAPSHAQCHRLAWSATAPLLQARETPSKVF